MKDIIKAIYSSSLQSFRGWKIWHKICRKYNKNRFLAVLIPYATDPYNYCALLYLDDLLKDRRYEKAIILTTDENILEYEKRYTPTHGGGVILDTIICSQEQANDLMRYYSLYCFDERFVLATFNIPYGKGISTISSIPNFDFEEAFAYGVYKIRPYSKRVSRQLQK